MTETPRKQTTEEYRSIPDRHCLGRWIITYAKPVRGFENMTVDSASYPSLEAAETEIGRLTNAET